VALNFTPSCNYNYIFTYKTKIFYKNLQQNETKIIYIHKQVIKKSNLKIKKFYNVLL
jgi:hypothetical protein